MPKYRIAAVLLAAVVVAGCFPSAQSLSEPEQTQFSAEEPDAKHPVPVPDAALAVLRSDKRVVDSMESEEPPLKTPPQSWFSASILHLGSRDEQDLIVIGLDHLAGAHSVPFWILRPTSTGYNLVLRTQGHDLEVKRHHAKGFRDIEASDESAATFMSVIYRFDGEKYVQFKDKSKGL